MSRDELLKLLLEGKSTRKIAEELNVGKSTVGYWINKYNLNEYLKYKKHENNYSFNKIDSKEKAYTLGFILADSNITPKNIVEISVEKRDAEILNFISNVIQSNISIDNTFNKEKRRFPRARTSRKINDILKFTGGRLKKERHYPRVRKDLERYLLLGFFEADGCITWGIRKDRNRLWHKVTFTSQLHLLEGIQKMLYNNIGISSIIRPKSNEDCYIIEFSNKEDILKFINYIYPKDDSFIILQRKYLKANALRLELEEFGGNTNK